MKTTILQLTALAVLTAAVGAVVWLAARHSTLQQPMSLAVVVDRGTEAMDTADRVGMMLTRIPAAEEIQLGRAIADRVTASSAAVTSVDQERRRAYVAAIVATLVERGGLRRPVIPYTAQVLESPEANAYALPGGWVSITVPLLDLLESEAEVAAVMGHEIAHVDLRHCIERIQYGVVAGKIGGPPFEAMVSVGTGLWSLGYADEQELEADRQGMLYAARAGYHPQAAYRAHERLAKLYGGLPHRADRLDEEIVGMLAGALDDYFATHPPSPERLTHLERAWHEQRLDVEAGTWYLGRENHRLRVARSERELAGEWITGELP